MTPHKRPPHVTLTNASSSSVFVDSSVVDRTWGILMLPGRVVTNYRGPHGALSGALVAHTSGTEMVRPIGTNPTLALHLSGNMLVMMRQFYSHIAEGDDKAQ